MAINKMRVRGYLILFTVEGKGEFPLDMLRHDACWPSSQTDAAKAFATLPSSSRVARRPLAQSKINLTMWSANGAGPEVARWNSFGWRVVA